MKSVHIFVLAIFCAVGLALWGVFTWGWSLKGLGPSGAPLGMAVGSLYVAWSQKRLRPKQIKNLALLLACILVGAGGVVAFNYFY